jgi:hypothetical protein
MISAVEFHFHLGIFSLFLLKTIGCVSFPASGQVLIFILVLFDCLKCLILVLCFPFEIFV